MKFVMEILGKIKGVTKSPPRSGASEIVWSLIGGFVGTASIAYLHYNVVGENGPSIMLIASFGASAVLLYGAKKSPFAQPRNLLGGHIFSALIGVVSYKLFHGHMWLAASVSVSASIFVMHITKTLHPPGGATALFAVTGGEKVHSLGFYYALIPVALGVFIMLVIALIVNNMPKTQRYPEYWL